MDNWLKNIFLMIQTINMRYKMFLFTTPIFLYKFGDFLFVCLFVWLSGLKCGGQCMCPHACTARQNFGHIQNHVFIFMPFLIKNLKKGDHLLLLACWDWTFYFMNFFPMLHILATRGQNGNFFYHNWPLSCHF